jgi:hypothetical protein
MLNLASRLMCGLLATAMSLQGPASLAIAAPAPAPQQSKSSGGGGAAESPSPTLDAYHKLYSSIFVELFGQPYNPKQWSYPLTQHVTKEGTVPGKNQYGQDFKFEALLANPIDITTLPDLTAAQVAMAQAANVQYTAAQGWLHGPFASVPVDAIIISRTIAGANSTNLMITERLPDNHPLLHANDSIYVPDLPPPPPAEYTITEPDPTPYVDPDFAHYLELQTPPPAQLAAMKQTFETLFGSSPVKNEYALPFAKNVSAPGAYEGKPSDLKLENPDAALPFTFTVASAIPVDIKTMPQVKPEYVQMAADAGLAYHRVGGWLSTEAGAAYVDAIAVAQNGGPSSIFSLAVMQEPGPSQVEITTIWFPLIIPIPYWCLDQDCVDACKAARDAAIAAANAAFDAAKNAAQTAYDSAKYAADIARTVARTAAGVAYGVALRACATSQASRLLACALIAGIFLGWFTGGASLIACLAQVAAIFAACAAVASAVYAAALVGIDAAYNAAIDSARATYDAAVAAAAAARDAAIDAAIAAYDACVAACWYICWTFIIIWIGF